MGKGGRFIGHRCYENKREKNRMKTERREEERSIQEKEGESEINNTNYVLQSYRETLFFEDT